MAVADDDEQMTIDERRKYLKRMRARYQMADRAGRGPLLSEMEAVTGLHRKSLLRLLHAPSLERQPRQRQRGRRYSEEVERVVVKVWASLDFICAERLTPTLLATARHLERFGVFTLAEAVAAQLAQISEASVTRLLARHRTERLRLRLPRSGPERANSVTKEVPMTRIPWQTTQPGHCEVDLVHHAGATTAGEYAHTLQLVDVATGWSERVALPNRGQAAMDGAFRTALARLPFALVELHPDNGREFFNWHLKRLYPELVPGLTLSRSRPYHKNDNRFVEQKNDSLVRQYVGYARFDTPEQVAALDALYADMSVYYNLFQPVLRLAEKTPLPDAQGRTTRIRRRWDTAQTPYQRLLATGTLGAAHRERLQTLYEQTNPLALRQRIYDQLAVLRGLTEQTAPTEEAAPAGAASSAPTTAA
ncbi:MAG TPA: integrase [Ktedonobacterales bacterium]